MMQAAMLSTQKTKIILFTAFITMVITSVAWVGLGAVGYWFIYHENPTFTVQVEHPDVVDLGDEFELKVKVENSGSKTLQLSNVDFYESLTDGFEILNISPKPSSTEKIMGIRSYYFRKNLAPGKIHEVTLRLKAKEEGLWTGDIDACNVMQNMVTYYTEIEVVGPAVAP